MTAGKRVGPMAVEAIRTLALVGPAGAGKTQLAEALLAASGMVGAAGSVGDGNTVSDWDPVEKRVGHSLQTSLLHLDHDGVRIHLLDTPGGAEFLGQSLPAFDAVETAAIVLHAGVGVEPMARRMMEQAAEQGLDRLVIVNRIDTPGADLPAVLAEIREAFGRECLPLTLPDAGATKVVDCFHQREGHSDFGSVAEAHRALVEQVVEVDAAFVERYLNEGDVEVGALHGPLEQALREGHLIPVVFTSARTGAGVRELLEVIVRLLPNPTEANPPAFLRGEGEAAEPFEVVPDPAQHVVAHVFKVMADPYVGKLGIFRVHQGTVAKDGSLYIGDGRKPFRVAHLYLLQGRDHVEVGAAGPGDIVAVSKVPDLHFDAVLHDAAEDDHLHRQPLALPVPVHGLAVEPLRRGDEHRLWEILTRLVDEDPCLRLEPVATTGETVLYGLGELHLQMLLERLRETFHFEVVTRPPRIAYRETIAAAAEGHHRHKKQTGGAGQFGEVFLRVEPLPRGAGFEFVDAVKGGTIPGVYLPAVEKGVREALATGAVAGYPIVDVRVIVHDGKHHPVDSKEVAFVTAGRKAFLDAVRAARPTVLEPIAEVEVTVPEGAVGEVTGDLSARRGMITGTAHAGAGWLAIQAQAPVAELASYSSRLHSLTAGAGRYRLALSHYEPVPLAVQERLIAEHQAPEES